MFNIDYTSKEFWYVATPILLIIIWEVFLNPAEAYIKCDMDSCTISSSNMLNHQVKNITIKRSNIKSITFDSCYDWLSTGRHSKPIYRIYVNTNDGKTYAGSRKTYVTRSHQKEKVESLSHLLETEQNIYMDI